MLDDPSNVPRSRRRRRALVRWTAALALVVVLGAWAWSASRPTGDVDDDGPTTAPATELPVDAGEADVWYAAPDGEDDGDGSEAEPFGSLSDALEALEPGDTLLVRGGVFREDVQPEITPGERDAPVTVQAYPGERPVIEGLLWLEEPDHWSISGLNVTWSDENGRRDHMVKFTGGDQWEFTDAEVWGARSYAAILVAGEPSDFRLARLFVHDTREANDTNQDHLIYLNSGSGGGVVERCVLARSENGRGIKIGAASRSSDDVENLVIRYNTFYENLGPSSIQLSYDASDNLIERNIFVRPGEDGFAVTTYRFDGEDNIVRDNLAWEAVDVVEPDRDGLIDDGGNSVLDPRLEDPEDDDFRPQSPAAAAYGHLGTDP